jgi:hypothetical protein
LEDSPKPDDVKEALAGFARKGFLLVDSSPFAENFSGRRTGERYQKLVKSCSSFLLEKIGNGRIEWADEVKVGLAFKLNGMAIIESLPDGIRFPTEQVVGLSDRPICADGSGYTSPTMLRAMFGMITSRCSER